MGNKKKKRSEDSLGKTLIKDRFSKNRGKKFVSNDSMLHTTEIQDGYDWGRLNLCSVTEESSFQEFLSTAELAGTEFQAEKLNIRFVNSRSNVGLLTSKEVADAKTAHERFKEVLKIPRRPEWGPDTTAEELEGNERESFLVWRRSLAQLQENEGILLTPYEKNLEFWRQLWRVVERSDVIVQIADARNPLLFRCDDLEKYVKEVSDDKMNLLLINKADFLNDQQRKAWAVYFSSIGVRVVFFSARLAAEEEEERLKEEKDIQTLEKGASEDEEENNLESIKDRVTDLENAVEQNANVLHKIIDKIEDLIGQTNLTDECEGAMQNSSKLLSRNELIELFRTIHQGPKVLEGVTTIGLVGYPNVGKSSTINALLTYKKVSVSATPGKTKHFQTLYLDKDLLLCDCPGLVMPSFVFTKAEMILSGILPIDQMKDHVPPTNLITSLIPRHVLEDKYGIMIPTPLDGEDPDRSPTAEEILNAYAYNRGFMTANGQPDNARAARYILKDYMNGKLLYCHGPPDTDQSTFNIWPERTKAPSTNRNVPPNAARAVRPYHVTMEDLDRNFFKSPAKGVHVRGADSKGMGVGLVKLGKSNDSQSEGTIVEKPWKQLNRHKNKGKKEKLRRVYADLDQH